MLILKVMGFTVLFRLGLELLAYLLKRRLDKKLLDEKTRSFLSILGGVLTSFA